MASKTDNTKQTIFDLKAVILDLDDEGNKILTNEEIGTIKIKNLLEEFLGQEIDFKIGGDLKISNDMFGEDE
mgnify:CR=1 FL=1